MLLQESEQSPLALLATPLLSSRLTGFATLGTTGTVFSLLNVAFHTGFKDPHTRIDQPHRAPFSAISFASSMAHPREEAPRSMPRI
ncbi:hypothetical protein GC163_20250 [bacterium]|nr:hypothetical protein [bacterium]